MGEKPVQTTKEIPVASAAAIQAFANMTSSAVTFSGVTLMDNALAL